MVRNDARDPEVQALLQESLMLIAKAEKLYAQLTVHQVEMAGFLRRASEYVDAEEDRRDHGA